MMKKNGLTLSMIFEAQSANYGEGIGNITQLKKMTKGDGNTYTYISRQALRYNIVNQMGCDNTPVDAEQKVVQFSANTSVKDYPEIDLFGYMKTASKKDKKGGQKTRCAVARLSNAISLEAYNSDLDFLTNMGLAKRGENLENAIAQSEIHNSFYCYTITIDLDRVGIDENDDVDIPNEEKAKRVIKLLNIIQFLWRDIKGRRENLSPLFAIGGIYKRKNPYFEGRLELNKGKLNVNMLNEVVNSCEDTKENTFIGSFSGKFKNADEVKEFAPSSVNEFFEKIKKEVESCYA